MELLGSRPGLAEESLRGWTVGAPEITSALEIVPTVRRERTHVVRALCDGSCRRVVVVMCSGVVHSGVGRERWGYARRKASCREPFTRWPYVGDTYMSVIFTFAHEVAEATMPERKL